MPKSLSRVFVSSAFALGVAAGFAAGCQVYDFEPVQPLVIAQHTIEKTVIAKSAKPNLLLAVDKSQSMDLPADPADPDCPSGCGTVANPCPLPACPTRWTELQGAMNDFLTNSGSVARMGLATFANIHLGTLPDGGFPSSVARQCGASLDSTFNDTAQIRIALDATMTDDAAVLSAKAIQVRDAIMGINTDETSGGTPTGKSIRQIATIPALASAEREDFILLLTDGLPNCNPDNPNTNTSADCRCTLGASCPEGPLGCLDAVGTAAEISTARARGIRTIVVGFGAETATGDGPMALNMAAAAGGFPKRCNADGTGCAADDTCNTTTLECNLRKYYQASNRAELVAELAKISADIDVTPCDYVLSEDPTSPELLVVYITETGKDPVRLEAGPDTFTYTPGLVKLVGATCDLVSNATPTAPVKVEIRIIVPM